MTSISLSEKNKKLLLPYQIGNAENIIRILTNNTTCGDFSDTGTGKTYTAIAACATMKLNPIIICPKSVMNIWKKVCEIFNVKPFIIVNYETIKNMKMYDKSGNRKLCSYIRYDEKNKKYIWKDLPEKCVFVFDEVHKSCNINSYNGKLLLSTKDTNKYIIMLSATAADTVEKVRVFAYMLNFISKSEVDANKLDFNGYMKLIDAWINRDDKIMIRFHNMLMPSRMTRMTIDTIPDFPKSIITAKPFSMGKKTEEKIQKEYSIIFDALEELKEKKKKDKHNPLVSILRATQAVEMLKVATIVELAIDFLEQHFSIVIFVNFSKTLDMLASLLKTNCVIRGEQSDNERQTNIDLFQNNKEKIIICMIQAGGVGISLHDLHGRKRVSLISPCWSAIVLKQAIGRIFRAGSKSTSLQYIIFTSNTVEEKISDKLEIKLKTLDSLNDGDVNIKNIVFEKKPEQRRM
jgi:SNF2 family DNA or RNA helicase